MIDFLVLRENIKQSIYENDLGLYVISDTIYTPYTGYIMCPSLKGVCFDNEESAIETVIDYLDSHELI